MAALPQDIPFLKSQGYTDEEIANINPIPQQQQTRTQAVENTLKAHLGSYLGGSAAIPSGALGGAIAGGEAGLEAGSVYPIVGNIIGGIGGGLLGAYAGQKAQQALESPDTYNQQQLLAQQASEQHPYVSGAADLTAGALASGGLPSTAGVRDLVKTIGGQEMTKAAKGALLQSVLNPAIATGQSLATGQGIPSIGDLAGQALGGALFSNTWLPHGRFAGGDKDEAGHGEANNGNTSDGSIPAPENEQTTMWNAKDEDGNYKIRNSQTIGSAFKKAFIRPYKDIENEEERIGVSDMNITLSKLPIDQKRQMLHMKALADMDKSVGNEDTSDKDYNGGEMPNINSGKLEGQEAEVPPTSHPNPPIIQTEVLQSILDKKITKPVAVQRAFPNLHLSDIDAQEALRQAKLLQELHNNNTEEETQNATGIREDEGQSSVPRPQLEGRQTDSSNDMVEKTPTGEEKSVQGQAKAGEINPVLTKITPNPLVVNPLTGERSVVQSPLSDFNRRKFLHLKMADPSTSNADRVKYWTELEQLKNKYKGMVPPVVPEDHVIAPNGLQEHIMNNRGTTSTVLHILANTPDHPFAPLAGHLLKAMDNASRGVKWIYDPTGRYTRDGRSNYDPTTDTVYIARGQASDSRTIMEEAIHSMVTKKLPIFREVGAKHLKELQNYLKNGKNSNVKGIIQAYLKVAERLGVHDQLFGKAKNSRQLWGNYSIGSIFLDIKTGKQYPNIYLNTLQEVNDLKQFLKLKGIEPSSFHNGGKDNYSIRLHQEDLEKLKQLGYIDNLHTLKFNESKEFTKPGLANNAEDAQHDLRMSGSQTTKYAMGSLDEFIAQAFKDHDFQRVLANIPFNETKSVWQHIIDAVRELLGMDKGTGTMLDNVLHHGTELIHSERLNPRNEGQYEILHPDTNGTGDRDYVVTHKPTGEQIYKGRDYNETHDAIARDIMLSQDNGKVSSATPKQTDIPEQRKWRINNNKVATGEHSQDYKLPNNLTYGHLYDTAVNGSDKEVDELYNKLTKLNPELSNIKSDGQGSGGRFTSAKRDIIAGVGSKFKVDNIKYYVENYPHNQLGGSDSYIQPNGFGYRVRPVRQSPPLPKDGHSLAPTDIKLPNDKYMGRVGLITRSVIDKIHDIGTPTAHHLADRMQMALDKATELKGRWKNSIVLAGQHLTQFDRQQLMKAFNAEMATKKPQMQMLTNNAQRQFYKIARQKLWESGEYRMKIGEPILQVVAKGDKNIYLHRDLRQDPTYFPGMANQKVTNIYRANTDHARIAQLDKEFHDYNTKVLKMSDIASQERIENYKNALQGSTSRSDVSHQDMFNGNRKAMGTPLPPSFREADPVRNLERYFDRSAIDASHYEMMEKDPQTLRALGQTHDAWGNKVISAGTHNLANNPAVKEGLSQWKLEHRNPAEHNETSLAAAVTSTFISGPPLEIHKFISNIASSLTLASNPIVAARALIHGMANLQSGYNHAIENGVVKLTARSALDMLRGGYSAAERMQSLAAGIRKIASLNDLTTKVGGGLMQAINESIIPSKILRAQRGDITAQKFLKRLDPTYDPHKIYNEQEIQQLASRSANLIHGTGDIRSLPGWMLNDSEFSGFFSLAHWSVAQTNNFMKRIYEPALRGDIQPLIMGVFGAAIGGYMIGQMRQAISGKRNGIPSLHEIASSDRGLEGNPGLIGYNMIAAMQYSGFGGLLSQVAKLPFDAAYKNNSGGATFPLDEVATDLVNTLHNVQEAIMNDPNVNWVDMTKMVSQHILSTNFQLSRIAINQGINNGFITGMPAEKKELGDKMNQLRRFDMAEGLPYADIDEASNPYMNIEQKKYKLDQNLPDAIHQLPQLVSNIIQTYHDRPDVMMSKLKALKQNDYTTFPSMEDTPISFFKYLGYLNREEGPQAATQEFQDYMRHRITNEVKSSVVP